MVITDFENHTFCNWAYKVIEEEKNNLSRHGLDLMENTIIIECERKEFIDFKKRTLGNIDNLKMKFLENGSNPNLIKNCLFNKVIVIDSHAHNNSLEFIPRKNIEKTMTI